MRCRTTAGFTLLEMLLVIFLTTLVMTSAVAFYVQIHRASERAVAQSLEGRRAAVLLDHVARDLQGAYLIKKPDEVDPADHPWVFLAERRYGDGADRLLFASRSHVPTGEQSHASDLEMVAYVLEPDVGEGYRLVRWTSPVLPEQPSRAFPRADDRGAALLADGLSAFSVRLQSDTGEWATEWDSTTLIESSELPVAAEVQLAWLPERPELGIRPRSYQRNVVLPLDAVDLKALVEGRAPGGDGEEDEEDGDCTTVQECLDQNPEILSGFEGTIDIEPFLDQCVRDVPVPGIEFAVAACP
ncbi:MAG: prepilin-type N-terminal cleavage/methylation domain-containing protein [Proteobacteria bacterium]|nr:prepilin-type N-terminal cleavage/methylation domain-containing protein [Pseudomonadota bacterium]